MSPTLLRRCQVTKRALVFTVWDVMAYVEAGWLRTWLGVTS